ncbi:DNA-binding MarR family transcriptional regulator [Dysgonomonas alginatilytica]|uniref:DNA-binding MarR family transcriptional regulator n=1 Tax=Dysgonomonas alginatilytica TaxID=1605892 RepID=A0A2V3PNI1_9BACT|nr:MarR family transcriptional regulator [Dysgonomonas alginatilytica]PXV62492.1 DNA-binding MarR family transcriptional regulator [Dysgonomonas alginatilytica]
MNNLYSLGFLLNRASFSLDKMLRIELKRNNIELPHSQFIVLRCLYYKDGLSQQEIATLLCKDAAAIKRTIDNLEDRGLVCRIHVSQRENAIQITEEGKNLMPLALKCGDLALEKVLKDINSAEYELLKQLLQRIYSNVEESK